MLAPGNSVSEEDERRLKVVLSARLLKFKKEKNSPQVGLSTKWLAEALREVDEREQRVSSFFLFLSPSLKP